MRRPILFRVYYGLVLAAAAALVALAWGSRPEPPWLIVCAGLALLVIAEASPVRLPGGGQMTAGTMVDLPLLLVVGPFWTAAADVAATLVVQGLFRRRPLVRVAHNAAIYVIGAFAAAGAYTRLGGRIGEVEFPEGALALAACGVAFFVVNSTCVSIAIGLTEGPSAWRVWQRNFQSGILHHLVFVALGTLAAVVWRATGAWGLALVALPVLVSRHAFQLSVELKSDLKDFVRTLTEVLEEVDPYTRHHSVRVATYSVRLARGLRRPEREVEEIEYAALVHDLGKIGPQHQYILQKPGSLSHEEQRTLRAHPAAGAEIVAKVRTLARVAEIVRSHHERPDGQGYPFGLRADDVPIGARILNVADAFDAMTSDRPYRRALPVEAALRELERGAGTQFDDGVVQCLLRLHGTSAFALVPSPSSEDLQLLRLRTRVGGAGGGGGGR
jgi:putative nucleotidyltransferase with HDIG domain